MSPIMPFDRAIEHCACNLVTSIVQFVETVDIGGLIAPRSLLIETGGAIPFFSVAATCQAMTELRAFLKQFDPHHLL